MHLSWSRFVLSIYKFKKTKCQIFCKIRIFAIFLMGIQGIKCDTKGGILFSPSFVDDYKFKK